MLTLIYEVRFHYFVTMYCTLLCCTSAIPQQSFSTMMMEMETSHHRQTERNRSDTITVKLQVLPLFLPSVSNNRLDS